EQQVIFELKQLAIQNKVELTDLIFEGIQLIFQTHNWPPTPPQKTHQTNTSPPQNNNTCNCGKPIERLYRLWQDKQVYKCCRTCLNKIPKSKLQAYATLENGQTKYWTHTT
ncbi:MAG: hypothetical protein LBE76_08320, partial [Nitrososphaerota archaeon]|nr:hypothetical protein [Nitrososphaerota archaeon]